MSYSVYHGGSLYGMGRWSGPHASLDEAERSAAECRQVVGGDPIVYDDETDRPVDEDAASLR